MATRIPPYSGATHADVVRVLLSAGAGTRFKSTCHKLLTRPAVDEPTVLERSLRAAASNPATPVIVVTGALDETALRHDPQIAQLLDREHVQVCAHPDWRDGQATSLHAGLDAARSLGATAAVIGLADQPFIDADAWQRVGDELGKIVVATYDGERGNPVKLHTTVWDLIPTSGDQGARTLMRTRPDLVVEVACTGSFADIDTTEDLSRWQSN